MSIQAVDTPEVLLQLISLYKSSENQGPTPQNLWQHIADFIAQSEQPIFASYRLAGVDPVKPNGQFLGDLGELIEQGFVALRDGRLTTTHIGQCLAFARELPSVLLPLARQVLAGMSK